MQRAKNIYGRGMNYCQPADHTWIETFSQQIKNNVKFSKSLLFDPLFIPEKKIEPFWDHKF